MDEADRISFWRDMRAKTAQIAIDAQRGAQRGDSMFYHSLEVEHSRVPEVIIGGEGLREEASSNVTVCASGRDLVEAWRELLSRLPNDTYEALKRAMVLEPKE